MFGIGFSTIGVSNIPSGYVVVSSGNWILATGFWDDTGVWDDNAVWID